MAKRNERIEMLELRQGYYPKRFLWRGRQHAVLQVKHVSCQRRGLFSPIDERKYCILTDWGQLELVHDLGNNIWSVSGVQSTWIRPAMKSSNARSGSSLPVFIARSVSTRRS